MSSLQDNAFREFPGGPVVRIPGSQCFDQGSIPGQATEIPQATWCGQKKDEIPFKTKDRVGMKGCVGGWRRREAQRKNADLISSIHRHGKTVSVFLGWKLPIKRFKIECRTSRSAEENVSSHHEVKRKKIKGKCIITEILVHKNIIFRQSHFPSLSGT